MAGIKGIYIYNEAGEIIGATGGKLAALKNLQKDPDFYKKMGSKGGQGSSNALGNAGGFAANNELARKAGALGGSISRRKARNVTE